MSIDTLKSRLLFRMEFSPGESNTIGQVPLGTRRITGIKGGSFEGPELRGEVLPGGADWVLVRPDQVTLLDVRITLQTDDGAGIFMQYRGIRTAPPEVLGRLARREPVEYGEYYMRSSVQFETAAPKYARLNDIVAVGNGARTATGLAYTIFEIL